MKWHREPFFDCHNHSHSPTPLNGAWWWISLGCLSPWNILVQVQAACCKTWPFKFTMRIVMFTFALCADEGSKSNYVRKCSTEHHHHDAVFFFSSCPYSLKTNQYSSWTYKEACSDGLLITGEEMIGLLYIPPATSEGAVNPPKQHLSCSSSLALNPEQYISAEKFHFTTLQYVCLHTNSPSQPFH